MFTGSIHKRFLKYLVRLASSKSLTQTLNHRENTSHKSLRFTMSMFIINDKMEKYGCNTIC